MSKRQVSLNSLYPLQVQLLIACKIDRLDLVKRLLDGNGVDPTFDNNKPLECCCENGRDKIATHLLSLPGVTFSGNSALKLAMQFGHTRCIALASDR